MFEIRPNLPSEEVILFSRFLKALLLGPRLVTVKRTTTGGGQKHK